MNIKSAKLAKDPISGNDVSVLLTGANDKIYSVPFDPANTDYQEYLRWCEAGNVPLPADEVQS